MKKIIKKIIFFIDGIIEILYFPLNLLIKMLFLLFSLGFLVQIGANSESIKIISIIGQAWILMFIYKHFKYYRRR
jgi:hypothetical protein